jgi:hypothetical protein
VVLMGADVLRYAPDDLSYFTPFIRPTQSYKFLTDSSLDWGQGLLALRQYQREHPDEAISLATVSNVAPQVYGIRAHTLEVTDRVAGTVVISATELSGQLLKDPNAYQWVLQYPMIKLLDHSLFVFRVPPQAARAAAVDPPSSAAALPAQSTASSQPTAAQPK